jgi:electron-transferring-flavoprotein dehydrogenase
VRNFRKYFHFGLWPGIVLGGLDLKICRGKLPWTLHQKKEDRAQTGFANEYEKIHYPLPDGKITFDRISSLYLANLVVTENQPNHLILRDPNKSIDISYQHYAAPEQRYCPAGVYEILFNGEKQPKLHINAANCIHCKTCAIKDPAHNIEWVVPEGGSGPDYQGM